MNVILCSSFIKMSYYSNDGRMSCWSVLLISFVEKVVEEEIVGRLTWIHPFGSIATSGPHTQYRRQEIAPAHALSPGLQLLWWTKSGSIVCREWRRVMQFHENKSNKWRRGGPISHTHTKEYTFELTSDMGIACAALSSNLIRTMTGAWGCPSAAVSNVQLRLIASLGPDLPCMAALHVGTSPGFPLFLGDSIWVFSRVYLWNIKPVPLPTSPAHTDFFMIVR